MEDDGPSPIIQERSIITSKDASRDDGSTFTSSPLLASDVEQKFKLYKYRHMILSLFCLAVAIN